MTLGLENQEKHPGTKKYRSTIQEEIGAVIDECTNGSMKKDYSNFAVVYKRIADRLNKRYARFIPELLPSTLDEIYTNTGIPKGNIAQVFQYLGIDLAIWIEPKLEKANIYTPLSDIQNAILKQLISDQSNGIITDWSNLSDIMNRYSLPSDEQGMAKILNCNPEYNEILYHLGIGGILKVKPINWNQTRSNKVRDSRIKVQKNTLEVAKMIRSTIEVPDCKRLLERYIEKTYGVLLEKDDIRNDELGITSKET